MTDTPQEPAAEDIVERILRDVAELPDRTSPDDAPNMMLVTADELSAIVLGAIAAAYQRGRLAGREDAAKVVESQHYASDDFEAWAALEKAISRIRSLPQEGG